MTLTAELYTAAAGDRLRSATEKSVEVWKQGAQGLTDRVDMVPQLPTVDLTHGVERYFEFVQKTVDAQREIATLWVELLTSLSGTIREQTEKVPPGRRAGRQDRRPGRRAGRGGRASRQRVGRLAEDEQDTAASGHHGSERPPNPPEADQRRAGRPAGRPGSRPKMPGRSTKLGAVATGQSSWRASVVFDHHWAVPVREHQLGGHSACAGLDGRQVISAIKTDILRCAWRAAADRGGRRRSTRVLVVGWIATNFFVVNMSARSVMVTHLSAWVLLTGPA